MMNWEGYGRNLSWSFIKHYLSICLKQAKKIHKNPVKVIRLWANIQIQNFSNTKLQQSVNSVNSLH